MPSISLCHLHWVPEDTQHKRHGRSLLQIYAQTQLCYLHQCEDTHRHDLNIRVVRIGQIGEQELLARAQLHLHAYWRVNQLHGSQNSQKRTNRWRVILGGDEGACSTMVDPRQRRRRGAALLAGSGGSGQRLGAGGCGAAPRRDSARRYGRNRRRRAGRKQGRAAAEGGGKRAGLKCPSRQLLLSDAGHRSREGETRVFPGWGRDFAAPLQNFCGPGRDAGLVGQFFRPVPAF